MLLDEGKVIQRLTVLTSDRPVLLLKPSDKKRCSRHASAEWEARKQEPSSVEELLCEFHKKSHSIAQQPLLRNKTTHSMGSHYYVQQNRHLYVIRAFLHSHINLNEVNRKVSHLMGWRQSYCSSTERNQISERETVETWLKRKQADKVCVLWILLLKLTEATWSSTSWLVSW